MTNCKQYTEKAKYCRISVLTILLVGLILNLGCSKNSAGPDNNSGLVFNDDGGFVITESMLDKRFNKITFPGTHNSFTAGLISTCENQGLTITQQLLYGIRWIEFDLDGELDVRHGDGCGAGASFNGRLIEIKKYAEDYPGQVITVKISDLVGGLTAADSYHRVNGRLEDTGLDEYVYNWDSTKVKDDPGRCFIPDPWPTLREMIESGKNVMFFHNFGCGEHDILDEAYVLGLSYNSTGGPSHTAQLQENFCRLMPFWSPPRPRQKDGPYRLFYIECCPDFLWAGSEQDAAKNNDGRKLYQVAKQHEVEILPDNRVVNYINVDYYRTSSAGPLLIDVVDACNRLNYERFGIDWEHCGCVWPLHPYEFDASKVEHFSRIKTMQAEVADVISDFKDKSNLSGNEQTGIVVSTEIDGYYDWRRIPEWAVDNDMFTRWAGSNTDDNHTWGIDLGERRSVNEIAIAWEYPHRRPGYKIFASNDDSRFADGISRQELLNDDGWLVVAEGDKRSNYNNLWLWDVAEFNGQGITDWRYVKIKVTDADNVAGHWPNFWEVRLYGPAN